MENKDKLFNLGITQAQIDVISDKALVGENILTSVLVEAININAVLPIDILKQHKMLREALSEIIKSCNPTDVTKHKKSHGMDLGEFYVGSCSVPSDKAIHMAIDALTETL